MSVVSATTNKIDVLTSPDFKYILNAISIGSVSFRVKAEHDAIVTLTSNIIDLNPNIEVVIGGWANTQCYIRRNGEECVSVKTANILKGDEFKGFWIRWNGGNISVGKEEENEPFMSWNNSNPFQIGYIGVKTGWGASGTWKIENFESEIDLMTQDNGKFAFLSVSNGSATFRIKAGGEAHIALTDRPDLSNPIAEIAIIGGWSNAKSVIRRNHDKPDKVELATPNILSENESRVFWISWKDDNISVGKDGEELALLNWLDPDPVHIRYIGVSTGFGFTGNWRIENMLSSVNEKDLVNPDMSRYVYYGIAQTVVSFRVKTTNEARIALSSTEDASGPIIELIIGEKGNRMSCIRCGGSLPNLVHVHTPNILHPNEFRGFWVRWSEGFIAAGHHADTQPFMIWKQTIQCEIKYVGFCTGHWKINY